MSHPPNVLRPPEIGEFFIDVFRVNVAWYVLRFPANPEVIYSFFTIMLRFAAKSLRLCAKRNACIIYREFPIFYGVNFLELEYPKGTELKAFSWLFSC